TYTCNSTQPPFGGRSTPISSVYGDCLGNIYCDATFAGSVTFSIEATRVADTPCRYAVLPLRRLLLRLNNMLKNLYS
ncbi:MAG TPA: hypothetical protein VLE70_05150, partial [Anaerolineae bacterium]|nr:hypothetical protein [Anaerolineae bacterium]